MEINIRHFARIHSEHDGSGKGVKITRNRSVEKSISIDRCVIDDFLTADIGIVAIVNPNDATVCLRSARHIGEIVGQGFQIGASRLKEAIRTFVRTWPGLGYGTYYSRIGCLGVFFIQWLLLKIGCFVMLIFRRCEGWRLLLGSNLA